MLAGICDSAAPDSNSVSCTSAGSGECVVSRVSAAGVSSYGAASPVALALLELEPAAAAPASPLTAAGAQCSDSYVIETVAPGGGGLGLAPGLTPPPHLGRRARSEARAPEPLPWICSPALTHWCKTGLFHQFNFRTPPVKHKHTQTV